MNKYIQAIRDLDYERVKELLQKEPKWLRWAEPSGKNALHYLCGIPMTNDPQKLADSLKILKLLLKKGMDINSVHQIPDKNCDFPAAPLWYAYAKGRNEALYKYLLKKGADPNNCMWAIAWNDDVAAAKLFIRHGARITENPSLNDLFLGAFEWKRYAFVKWLLGKGADVNTPGPGGLTALMFAVKRKDEGIIKLLLSYGADFNKTSKDGFSAMKLAELKGPRRILNLFREKHL